jgi:hypothetical protein
MEKETAMHCKREREREKQVRVVLVDQSRSSRDSTCFLWQGDPVAGIAEPLDEAPEDGVLLLRPRPPLHPRLVAAWRPPHIAFSMVAANLAIPSYT